MSVFDELNPHPLRGQARELLTDTSTLAESFEALVTRWHAFAQTLVTVGDAKAAALAQGMAERLESDYRQGLMGGASQVGSVEALAHLLKADVRPVPVKPPKSRGG